MIGGVCVCARICASVEAHTKKSAPINIETEQDHCISSQNHNEIVLSHSACMGLCMLQSRQEPSITRITFHSSNKHCVITKNERQKQHNNNTMIYNGSQSTAPVAAPTTVIISAHLSLTHTLSFSQYYYLECTSCVEMKFIACAATIDTRTSMRPAELLSNVDGVMGEDWNV